MTLTELTVTPFDPHTALPEQRLAVGQLNVDVFAFAYPGEPPLNAGKQALGLIQGMPEDRTEHFVVWDGGRAVGWGSLNYDTQQNLHLAHARLIVHPQRRREGLGRALAAALEEVARRETRRTITFVTSDRHAGGEPFARLLGAEAALPTRQSRLELAGVDRDLLAQWLIRPAGEPYRLHTWDGPIPGEFLERMADLMMVMNSAPKGELDMDDWRITPETIRGWEANSAESGERELLIAVEDTRSGELVGYTDVSWTPERASIIHQGSTAVRPVARGQGLGKWLKALMLDYLAQNASEARVIQTNNAEENAAMLGINVALGFKPWVAITEWQLRLK
ncbi:GNAT family N-acetyltransferase [Deinococcus sp. AJ005]|uniref:GNAT family N-acetyltransferase n=1 Tax=Deinococcus sp. AJ005 TaxID=2652443 RepID=UPI00125CD396|nr:GNAT family N-acetyltransferase [Deinococcus sp. AJ005]QFP77541.1 GNAT family N-acetyltransferase [Deinococcus sp. AJ005]